MQTDREIIKKIILTHSRNSGDYLPDYKYEDVITDILKQFSRPVENLVSQADSQAMPEPNQQLFTVAEVNEFLRQQKEICAELVAYKGAISKVEAWGMGVDELQDKCEELCRNANPPDRFVNKTIVKS